jgi:hypothetical protein
MGALGLSVLGTEAAARARHTAADRDDQQAGATELT